MSIFRFSRSVLVVLAACAMSGCATTSSDSSASADSSPTDSSLADSPPAAETALSAPEFIPTNFVARIQPDEVRYRTLLSLPSHAIWVDKTISEIKKAYEEQEDAAVSADLQLDADLITDHYLVIECHIETMFRDSSIAYDVSGLRNIDLYLQSLGGRKVYPLQHLLLTAAEEKQIGTLIQYNRTNVLVFAMEDVISAMKPLPDGNNTIRLYAEGFDSRFYFEWTAQEPIVFESSDPEEKPDITDVIRWRPTQTETYQVLKVRFTELYGKLGALTRLHRN